MDGMDELKPYGIAISDCIDSFGGWKNNDLEAIEDYFIKYTVRLWGCPERLYALQDDLWESSFGCDWIFFVVLSSSFFIIYTVMYFLSKINTLAHLFPWSIKPCTFSCHLIF